LQTLSKGAPIMLVMIFMIIGSIAIAIFTIPQLIVVIRTKNTVGINVIMYTIFLIGCITFIIDGAGMCTTGALSSGLPLVISNTICTISGGIIYVTKLLNARRAKQKGMSELAYCQSLNKKEQ
jgi:uncharacterized protein with PQ loop repeat